MVKHKLFLSALFLFIGTAQCVHKDNLAPNAVHPLVAQDFQERQADMVEIEALGKEKRSLFIKQALIPIAATAFGIVTLIAASNSKADVPLPASFLLPLATTCTAAGVRAWSNINDTLTNLSETWSKAVTTMAKKEARRRILASSHLTHAFAEPDSFKVPDLICAPLIVQKLRGSLGIYYSYDRLPIIKRTQERSYEKETLGTETHEYFCPHDKPIKATLYFNTADFVNTAHTSGQAKSIQDAIGHELDHLKHMLEENAFPNLESADSRDVEGSADWSSISLPIEKHNDTEWHARIDCKEIANRYSMNPFFWHRWGRDTIKLHFINEYGIYYSWTKNLTYYPNDAIRSKTLHRWCAVLEHGPVTEQERRIAITLGLALQKKEERRPLSVQNQEILASLDAITITHKGVKRLCEEYMAD